MLSEDASKIVHHHQLNFGPERLASAIRLLLLGLRFIDRMGVQQLGLVISDDTLGAVIVRLHIQWQPRVYVCLTTIEWFEEINQM